MSTSVDTPQHATDEQMVQPGQHHAVSIEKITHGGFGLAHIKEFPVLVMGGLPGQGAEVVITKCKDGHAEAKIEKITKRTTDEIPARCQHAHDFGGSTWQHLPYNKQLEYKEDIVRDTLEQLTPVDESVRRTLPGRVLKITPSPQVFHYRNSLNLSFGYQTMRSEERGGRRVYFDEDPAVGFYQSGQSKTVLPVTECHLYDEQLGSLLVEVNRFMEQTNLPVYNPKTRRGLLRSLLLRRGIQTGEHQMAFLVNGRKKDLEPLFQHFMRFAGRPGLSSLLVIEHTGAGERPDLPKIHPLVGKQTITERVFDLLMEVGPFSFFSANTLATEKLYKAVHEAADLNPRDTVLDAYCGTGMLGQYLARFCEKVVGVESFPAAIEEALRNAGRNRIANISFYRGRTEQVLTSQLEPGGKYKFDTIVVDPPRTGLHPKAIEAVLAHEPGKLVYVSSNGATFARDLGALLTGGYELRTVQPIDVFPHTTHVQTVALLQRK